MRKVAKILGQNSRPPSRDPNSWPQEKVAFKDWTWSLLPQPWWLTVMAVYQRMCQQTHLLQLDATRTIRSVIQL